MSNSLNVLYDRKFGLIGLICLIMLFTFSMLIDKTTQHYFNDTYIKVEEKDKKLRYSEGDSLRPVIKEYNKALVTGHPYFKLKKENILLGMFIPANFPWVDLVYQLLIISICLIFLKRLWKLDPDKPFSPQMVKGVKFVAITCFVFAAADYFRLQLINNYILDSSENFYQLEKFTFFSRPLWLIGWLFFWLYKIVKKASAIQEEQELTV